MGITSSDPRPDARAVFKLLKWSAVGVTTGSVALSFGLLLLTPFGFGTRLGITVSIVFICAAAYGRAMSKRMRGATRDDLNLLFDLETSPRTLRLFLSLCVACGLVPLGIILLVQLLDH